MRETDDLYIGYLPRAPRPIAAWIHKTVIAVLCGAALVALGLALVQNPFPAATFEFGTTRTVAGVIHETPVPSIDLAGGRRALLVAPGKHGAGPLIRGLDLTPVDLSGSRIQRGADLMIEIAPGSIRVSGARVPDTPGWSAAGEVALRGEIVDSKCYLGVMNPGQGKVHRDCAARCISGGVPPALIAADRNGRIRVMVLTGRSGRAINGSVLTFVGEPVSVSGVLCRRGDQLRLETDPDSIRRVE